VSGRAGEFHERSTLAFQLPQQADAVAYVPGVLQRVLGRRIRPGVARGL
jgi:hypothetical protein